MRLQLNVISTSKRFHRRCPAPKRAALSDASLDCEGLQAGLQQRRAVELQEAPLDRSLSYLIPPVVAASALSILPALALTTVLLPNMTLLRLVASKTASSKSRNEPGRLAWSDVSTGNNIHRIREVVKWNNRVAEESGRKGRSERRIEAQCGNAERGGRKQ